jgi:thymidylate synthase (FAD)
LVLALNEEIDVLDHGFVKLKAFHGDDLSVINAARVSFATEHETMLQGDDKLIAFLMRERHGTPFEHNSFTFHVKAPIFVVREWMRHRIASYNELSGRYKTFENPCFYVPVKSWRQQVPDTKPGAYKYEDYQGNKDLLNEVVINFNSDCVAMYHYLLGRGVAREQARLVLPLSLYTEFYFTVNARSLMNFLSLRNHEQAQYEIREYAIVLEELWSEEMPVTAHAFRENGRVAP